MKPLLFLISIFVILVGIPTSLASTFVGNGGNAGDVELMVTVRQIRSSLQSFSQEEGGRDLCECAMTFENHRICEGLNELSEDQAKFCTGVLKKNAGPLFELIKDDRRVRFTWTHESISVKEGDDVRAADAVTNASKKTVTLNQERFLDLSPSERVFLLSHELFHLSKWEGNHLKDRGTIGPFTSPSGQRKLINAMAGATVMQVDRQNHFKRYQKVLDRPQGWKKHWIDFKIGTEHATGGTTNNTYYLDRGSLSGFSYRYHWSAYGLVVQSSLTDNSDKVLTSIEVTERIKTLGAGLSYRYFPGKDPLTMWGQAYLVGSVMLEQLSSTQDVSDPFVGLTSQDSSLGLALECNYYIPAKWGLWGFGGAKLSYHNYEHPDFGLKYESLRYSLNLGVSYGF